MREKIMSAINNENWEKHTPEDVAIYILSLPSGYIAGEHEITIEMALKMFGNIITDYPSYPHIGYYGGRRISHDRA